MDFKTHTVIMTCEPNSTVVTCAMERKIGQEGELDDCNAPDKTSPQLLLKHQIGIILEHWRRYR